MRIFTEILMINTIGWGALAIGAALTIAFVYYILPRIFARRVVRFTHETVGRPTGRARLLWRGLKGEQRTPVRHVTTRPTHWS